MHCNYQDIFKIIERGYIAKGLSQECAYNVTQSLLIAEFAGEKSHGLRMQTSVNQMIANRCGGGGKFTKQNE